MSQDDDIIFEEAMRSLELPKGLGVSGELNEEQASLLARRASESLLTLQSEENTRRDFGAEDDEFLSAMSQVDFVEPTKEEREEPQRAQTSRAKRIRRGEMEAELQIDLHGLSEERAWIKLEEAVLKARRQGLRTLLVISGRGLHSKGDPVLQYALLRWVLGPLSEHIAEHAQAALKQGGQGARWLFLRP